MTDVCQHEGLQQLNVALFTDLLCVFVSRGPAELPERCRNPDGGCGF